MRDMLKFARLFVFNELFVKKKKADVDFINNNNNNNSCMDVFLDCA